ncbi:hypothetical protein CC2G_011829 [Coprinopsis cinerea AmutBmut pab1-1]|nr:hypothetical protein CC2G_011829 [Coprinopsis cinerea AmutBmut pab1-1]
MVFRGPLQSPKTAADPTEMVVRRVQPLIIFQLFFEIYKTYRSRHARRLRFEKGGSSLDNGRSTAKVKLSNNQSTSSGAFIRSWYLEYSVIMKSPSKRFCFLFPRENEMEVHKYPESMSQMD